MPSHTRYLLWITCWVGAALRFSALFANRFHADEALFAGWARLIAVWRDPLLLTQAVDKPPLLFYLQAMAYPLFGPVEWAARMPNLVTSILLIPITAMLAWALFRDATAALTAAFLIAVAPLPVQFSATAFSDPLLTFWLVVALYFAARTTATYANRGILSSFLAGLFLGLAVATKYQAIFFLPLLGGIAMLEGWRWREYRRALAGFVLGTIPLGLWMAARVDTGGLVRLQWANIGGLRPAWSWELWPRLVAQAGLWQLAFGRPVLVGVILVILVLFLTRRWWSSRASVTDWLLALFVLGYMLLHWLWSVPVWDRYLLPIFPLVAILIGRGVSWLWEAGQEWAAPGRAQRLFRGGVLGLGVLLVLAHLPVAKAAHAGQFPIGGQPSADGGAAEIAGLLADAPYGTVLYDHWYSWHWRYQLFDNRVYVSWFPHGDALVADLAAFGQSGPPRFIALPGSEISRPIVRRLEEAGYQLTDMSQSKPKAAMTLYRIEPARRTVR